jgi:hypothetical protein
MQEINDIFDRECMCFGILETPHTQDRGWIKKEQKGEDEKWR